MLKLIPKHWFSWDFRLEDPVGNPWGEVMLSFWPKRGSVTVGYLHFRVSRQGNLGPFVLEGPSGQMARAIKASVFKQEFTLTVEDRDFTLKRSSFWSRDFVLFNGGVRVGSISRSSRFSRRAEVMLPENMYSYVRAFVVWLTLFMWKRSIDSAGAGS